MARVKITKNRAVVAEIKTQPLYLAKRAEETSEITSAASRIMQPIGRGVVARRIRATGFTVGIHDPFGHLVEFGSVNNPAYAPLRRGALATGHTFKSLPKQ